MERQPNEAELERARERARTDAHARLRDETDRPSVDEPVVDDAGPYEFAPEDVRAEYDRVYQETLAARRRPR